MSRLLRRKVDMLGHHLSHGSNKDKLSINCTRDRNVHTAFPRSLDQIYYLKRALSWTDTKDVKTCFSLVEQGQTVHKQRNCLERQIEETAKKQ